MNVPPTRYSYETHCELYKRLREAIKNDGGVHLIGNTVVVNDAADLRVGFGRVQVNVSEMDGWEFVHDRSFAPYLGNSEYDADLLRSLRVRLRRLFRKAHSLLIAHGLEFEFGEVEGTCGHDLRTGSLNRHICIVVNHRYYGVDLQLKLFRGVFTDELNKSHKEIAAERAEGGAE